MSALTSSAGWLVAFSGPPGSLEIDPTLGLILGLFLVALNGFFVAAEFAIVKVRPTQLDPYVARGLRRGKVARHMVRHLDAYLSSTQLGITLASLALGWIGEPAFAWLLQPVLKLIPGLSPALSRSISLTAAFLTITVLHIVLGELAPKSLAIRKPEPTSLWVALPLYLFYKATYPAIWVLNHAANAVLSLVGIDPVTESELAHSEEELRLLLASSESSQLSAQKRQLLGNVFELSEHNARQAMVPRADVVFLSTERSLEENLALARASGHTRFPLVRGELDQVLGVVHIKDLFQNPEVTDLQQVRREIGFVPETLNLDKLLRRMRQSQTHMCAVLDEYGGVSGIVTLENVIEEIVGEIQDEFDEEPPELVKKGENLYQVAGAMLVDELEHALGVEFSERDEDTIAGVVLSEIGRSPEVGDRADLPPLRLEVTQVEGNRIRELEVEVGSAEAGSTE